MKTEQFIGLGIFRAQGTHCDQLHLRNVDPVCKAPALQGASVERQAVARGYAEVAEALLKHRADPLVPGSRGWSAVDGQGAGGAQVLGGQHSRKKAHFYEPQKLNLSTLATRWSFTRIIWLDFTSRLHGHLCLSLARKFLQV